MLEKRWVPKTEADFVAAGVRFGGDGVRGPDGRDELLEQLRGAVAKRVPMCEGLGSHQYGRCSTCGDPLPAYRSGHCGLCTLARRKVVGA